MGRRASAVAIGIFFLLNASPASGQTEPSECRRAVVFTLPSVTWADIAEHEPPHIAGLARSGAAASMSVRTNSARTTYASGFATIGAGARLDGGRRSGGRAGSDGGTDLVERGIRVAGLDHIEELAGDAGYGAVGGALGSALPAGSLAAIGNADIVLSDAERVPSGPGRYTLLSAMDRSGTVALAATGSGLLREDPGAPFGIATDPQALDSALETVLGSGCNSAVIDQGDLIRADMASDLAGDELRSERADALAAADAALGRVRSYLDDDRDLLLVITPTSPLWENEAHLGVAIVAGPGFSPGDTLTSSSTRRDGIVTLPDVAPTILAHLGIDRPDSMNGRAMVPARIPGDRIAGAVELDRESVFVDRYRNAINTWFVVFQVLVYVGALALLSRSRTSGRPKVGLGRWLQVAGLAVIGFPAATFLVGMLPAHDLGLSVYVLTIVAIDASLVAASMLLIDRPLDRLLALCAGTLMLLCADLVIGSALQMNTVFGYSPIVAGRFTGAGNISFAVMAVTTVLTATLVVHRFGVSRGTLAGIGILFAAVVIIDGAPPFGSDVGGVLALVPGFAATWLLLSGTRPNLRIIAAVILGLVLAVIAFIAIDLTRSPENQTHLGRLVEDVRARGAGVLWDTVARKATANIRVFKTSIYTLFVPPALGAMAWLLRRPQGSWHQLAARFPKLQAGLVAGLVVSIFGFAVNDSGIVIPAVVLSFLVPAALLIHLTIGKVIPE